MSTSAVSVPAQYLRRMVEIVSRGNGDQLNALEKVSSQIGVSPRAARRLMNEERKDCPVSLFQTIRGAYLRLCERQARCLIEDIRTDMAKNGEQHDFADLLSEAEALLAKIEKRKG